jgi:transcription elongation GreA/GreB family factor
MSAEQGEWFALKQRVHAACRAMIEARMQEAAAAMERATEAVKGEEKSSAGDKYETGRAMGDIERVRYAGILEQARRDARFFAAEAGKGAASVAPGSLIVCADRCFYLSTGLGKLDVDGHTVWAISAASPLGKELLGKTIGAVFTMGKETLSILALA